MINEPDRINFHSNLLLEGIDLDTTAKTIDPTIVPYGLSAVILEVPLCLN